MRNVFRWIRLERNYRGKVGIENKKPPQLLGKDIDYFIIFLIAVLFFSFLKHVIE